MKIKIVIHLLGDKIIRAIRSVCEFLTFNVYVGKSLAKIPQKSIVIFPCRNTLFCCGLTGIVSFKSETEAPQPISLTPLEDMLRQIQGHNYAACIQDDYSLAERYLCGHEILTSLLQSVRNLKKQSSFYEVFSNEALQRKIVDLSAHLTHIIDEETEVLSDNMGRLDTHAVKTMAKRIEDLKDIAWCLTWEISDNVQKVKTLISDPSPAVPPAVVKLFKNINSVLNSIDRLEVRGRDSAGLSMKFVLTDHDFAQFKDVLETRRLYRELEKRTRSEVLVNRSIRINRTEDKNGQGSVAVFMTYKIAAEVGSLGDNIEFLRQQISSDALLQELIRIPHRYHTVLSHTRWASVGAITEANCHPVDNDTGGNQSSKNGVIHVCLNGDIDNYLELYREYEENGGCSPEDITTDTKIIPIQIQKYVRIGCDMAEAFRRAVNDFEGSHAISMHTDLCPGKIFLAQKGSGQAVFVGLGDEHYMPTSEVYGFVEETSRYLKMDGEMIIEGPNGKTQGQIYILDQETSGELDGIQAMFYDGTPWQINGQDIKQTEITSRDIDRQGYYHYFLKEISESPVSVEKTLQNRWKIKDEEQKQLTIALDEKVVPRAIQKALEENRIQRIFVVGQGTAGIAASACSDILNYYLDDPFLQISAMKASELSGFKVGEQADGNSMRNTLVIAITQSGTTTDTNRAVEMVKERGAYTMGIVNRRDSDVTFKVDGVLYTSSGRDIEMSVASTKAFYSQIIAGALLGLYITTLRGRRSHAFVTEEIRRLLEIPSHMRKILTMHHTIAESAKRLAVTKTYWATVGSGPNKASADEIRIKLSELCYKTISSDYVEDKKHIDLSSEPLIIVCAAGTRANVIGDIIKDTAIFKAHKATPIVIANEGEHRFDSYAADVFYVPPVAEHLAPILNTLVGHIWGYYAALAINEGSRFLYRFREDIQKTIDDYAAQGLDVYEVVLEKSFREKIAEFYKEFRTKKVSKRLPTILGMEIASDLILLLKYLSGRLPVTDFDLDFGQKGTARNMLNFLFDRLNEAINRLARPVDAIKHQAKTVTVGTSRIRERLEGILFEALAQHDGNPSQLTNNNILVLKRLQEIVARINGSILYRISGLNLLGEPTDETMIEVIEKRDSLKSIPSRVEEDTRLKGTKRIIVRQGNVYIGKGRKDDRSILVIPVISTSPESPNMIEYLLLLNISFKKEIALETKITALGGKLENIKSIVQENSVAWEDRYLELLETDELFGRSAEKIGEFIVSRIK
ncbi:SIS domain-containing protein [Thermodesulfobacteriota bacterium]